METPQSTGAKPPKKKPTDPTDPTEPPDQQPPENPPPEENPPEQPEQPALREPKQPADPLPRLLDLMRRQMEVTLQMTGHVAEGQAAEWLRDLAAFQEEWHRHAEGTIAG